MKERTKKELIETLQRRNIHISNQTQRIHELEQEIERLRKK
jgi:hypothetical protein|tara:strand:+ start:1533 stop:1655 length:123 start_codon:yes stop_codon:yes gene_type:complete